MRKARKKPAPLNILVADFWDSGRHLTDLGRLLADEVAESLAKTDIEVQVVDRNRLRSFLDRVQIPSEELNDDTVMRWLSSQVDANAVLVGWFRRSGDSLVLDLKVLEVESGRILGDARGSLAISRDLQDSLGFRKKPRSTPGDPASRIGPEPGVFVAGRDGVSFPTCVSCPEPSYTNAARQAKFQGAVVLSVVINPDGRAGAIAVVKGAPYGISVVAIDAVLGWRFKPAMKEGRPVPVRMPIEVVFRLL